LVVLTFVIVITSAITQGVGVSNVFGVVVANNVGEI
jgi:hypothetical protein